MAEITLNPENFEGEVLESDKPVLVDFWAEWCGPCRMLAPVVAEIAEDFAGKIKVGKVNIDEEPELADKFRVEFIPTLILFKNGKPESISTGYVPKEKIEEMLR